MQAVDGLNMRVQFVKQPVSLAARPPQAERLAGDRSDNEHHQADGTDRPGIILGQIEPRGDPHDVDRKGNHGNRHGEFTPARPVKLVETPPRPFRLLSRQRAQVGNWTLMATRFVRPRHSQLTFHLMIQFAF
jgi:hypothetical protein